MLFFTGCIPLKSKNEQQVCFVQIQFGNYGGFSGLNNFYVLQSSGNLYKKQNDSIVSLKKIECSDLEVISKSIENIIQDTIVYNEKGNLTYLIEIITSTTNKKITWANDTQINNNTKQLYILLINTLKK